MALLCWRSKTHAALLEALAHAAAWSDDAVPTIAKCVAKALLVHTLPLLRLVDIATVAIAVNRRHLDPARFEFEYAYDADPGLARQLAAGNASNSNDGDNIVSLLSTHGHQHPLSGDAAIWFRTNVAATAAEVVTRRDLDVVLRRLIEEAQDKTAAPLTAEQIEKVRVAGGVCDTVCRDESDDRRVSVCLPSW